MSKSEQFFQPLAVAIASGESIRAAAELTGAAESTAYRIARSDGFREEVNRIRGEAVSEATGKLGKACIIAVETILELMKTSADDRVRLRAAVAVIERFEKLAEHHELRERLEELERSNEH